MIRTSAVVAFVLSAAFLAGCQMAQTVPAGSPLDGNWASSDGIFVATFQNSSFSSRDARTGAVLAQGSYSLQGGQVSMQWVSTTTQQQRSATCALSGPTTLNCQQPGATPFQLNRTA